MPQSKKKEGLPGKLFSKALEIADRETLEGLHKATGLGISWLRKFRAGEILNPSVNKVEKILTAFDNV